MIKILFICHGNICRSPMAEFIFKDMLACRGMADKFTSLLRRRARRKSGMESAIRCIRRRSGNLQNMEYHVRENVRCSFRGPDYDKYDYLIGMEERNREICFEFSAVIRRERVFCWIMPTSWRYCGSVVYR